MNQNLKKFYYFNLKTFFMNKEIPKKNFHSLFIISYHLRESRTKTNETFLLKNLFNERILNDLVIKKNERPAVNQNLIKLDHLV